MSLKYGNKELTRFKAKTGGKNKSGVDGFYENRDGERFFIKKPADKQELFAELLAGLILKEFMERKLIDEIYFPSLIIADFVRLEDGSYALIQPMVSFKELHKIIGTSYTDGSDRDARKEALYGSSYYPALMKQSPYFGLSTALMFSLLLGAHSVHSGNIVALNNKKMLSRQYGRLDWGDAFRYFANPKNNEDLLHPYENSGWFNYKKLTKDYFLNYKKIVGLFPAMAKKGISLINNIGEDALQKTLVAIVTRALQKIPAALIEQNIKDKFAEYIAIDSFKKVVLGPESDGGEFALSMAQIIKGRLQKITQLKDLAPSPAKQEDLYQSVIVSAPQMDDSTFVDEKYKDIRFARMLKIAPVVREINNIEKKACDLKSRHETKAYEAATTLVKGLRTAIQEYAESDENEDAALATFKVKAPALIKTAGETLGQHRKEWKYVLANLSLAVLLIGVGYLAAMLINKGVNDYYTFFRATKSQEKLNILDQQIGFRLK